ncbi:hypothetical protein NDU88_008727 [Pleurodeles waltl]|uniref:Sushi domain-containing protein n=1 Tax=Pleurodeles waltl TaxID=8319 RepID=A0AAV7QSK8_PLEWA|nr:hypothetical protein NDU88_008727 [Pleurodeles waltl]
MQSINRMFFVMLLLAGAAWSLPDRFELQEDLVQRKSARNQDAGAQSEDCRPIGSWNHTDLTEEQELLVKIITTQMEEIENLGDAMKNLNRTHINALVWSVQQVLVTLKAYQKEAYHKVKPPTCPLPQAPSNGGLVSVNMNDVAYCKPMCNKGYDFNFLRRSRLYEECGEHTAFVWTTQFIGGTRLAECIASNTTVSGGPTSYFPADSPCQKTIANSLMEDTQIHIFVDELKLKGVTGNHSMKLDHVKCGE